MKDQSHQRPFDTQQTQNHMQNFIEKSSKLDIPLQSFISPICDFSDINILLIGNITCLIFLLATLQNLHLILNFLQIVTLRLPNLLGSNNIC